MKSDLFTIIKKEFARFFGDKRMVMTALMPGILIYCLYSVMGSGFSEMHETEENYVCEIQVVHMPQVLESIGDIEGVSFNEINAEEIDEVKKAIADDEADLLVIFPEDFDVAFMTYDVATATEPAPNVDIYYNTASTESGEAYSVMTGLLDQLEQAVANKFDICNSDQTYDLASEEDVSAMIVSMIMPMLVIMMLYNGCMSAAVESIAGEKERGTIATLLVTPMKRSDLALGKMISLSVIGLISGTSSFVGIMLSLPKFMGGYGVENMTFGYTVKDYAVLLLVIIATTLVLVGLISIISAFAKSVKEAGAMATPLMLVVSLTGITNMMGNATAPEWYMYLIPVYNTVQCMNGVFSMDYQMIPVVITVCVNVLYAGVLAVILTKMFNSERIMYT